MRQIVLLGTVLAGAAGCATSTRADKSQPDERREVLTIVEAIPLSPSEIQAWCVTENVVAADTFVVRPNRIELRVGETFSLSDLEVIPLGAPNRPRASPHFTLNSPVAKLDGAAIRALSVGEAQFRILSFCGYLREGEEAARATVVPVVVRP